MAPKSSLLIAGTTTPKKPRAPARPLTTQGKIAKAAVRTEKRSKNVPRPPPTDSKPKPRSLPPPGEGLGGSLRSKSASKGKSSRASKPLTTQQKIRAAEAAAKAKGPQSGKLAVGGGPGKLMQAVQNAGAGGCSSSLLTKPKTKVAKAKPPGMMSVLRSQDASMHKFAKKPERNAVMYRRTQRAEKYLREKREKVLKDPEVRGIWEDGGVQKTLAEVKTDAKIWKALLLKKQAKWVEVMVKIGKLVKAGLVALPPSVTLDGKEQHEEEIFRLMDLPEELRAKIFGLVVVESKVFIRPDSITGREQPDLAMTSKQVRSEVLPVFYGKNTFAIDLSATGPVAKMAARPRCGGKSEPVTGLVAIERWASELEKGGWFGMIRHWVLDYAPADSWITGQRTSDDDDGGEDSSLMVSVRFTKKAQHAGSWGAAVEVHREAACVMQGFDEHGMCVVKRVPEWLNEAVIQVLDAAKRGSISGRMIVEMAKAVKARVHETGESRCEQVIKIIETDSGFGGE
ncbi:hypothetical protein LTR85_010291 [Meristemomyces frigidus]|nr:hypothetical protein LTR85_010291 [Meristemomyces frigidus]